MPPAGDIRPEPSLSSSLKTHTMYPSLDTSKYHFDMQSDAPELVPELALGARKSSTSSQGPRRGRKLKNAPISAFAGPTVVDPSAKASQQLHASGKHAHVPRLRLPASGGLSPESSKIPRVSSSRVNFMLDDGSTNHSRRFEPYSEVPRGGFEATLRGVEGTHKVPTLSWSRALQQMSNQHSHRTDIVFDPHPPGPSGDPLLKQDSQVSVEFSGLVPKAKPPAPAPQRGGLFPPLGPAGSQRSRGSTPLTWDDEEDRPPAGMTPDGRLSETELSFGDIYAGDAGGPSQGSMAEVSDGGWAPSGSATARDYTEFGRSGTAPRGGKHPYWLVSNVEQQREKRGWFRVVEDVDTQVSDGEIMRTYLNAPHGGSKKVVQIPPHQSDWDPSDRGRQQTSLQHQIACRFPRPHAPPKKWDSKEASAGGALPSRMPSYISQRVKTAEGIRWVIVGAENQQQPPPSSQGSQMSNLGRSYAPHKPLLTTRN